MSDLIPYGNTGLTVTKKEKDICDVLVGINQLRSFKLDVIEVLEWKDSLIRILPDIKIETLQFVIDSMMTGELEYNDKKGIQNLFAALKLVGENEDGTFYIKKPIW